MSVRSIRPVVRSIRWSPLAGALTGGLVILWLLRPEGADTAGLTGGLRLGAYLLAAAGALTLDDRAAATVASSPTPLGARRSLRLIVALAPVALGWCILLAVAWGLLGTGAAGLGAGALTVEAAGMVAFALVAAAVACSAVPTGLGAAAGPPALTLLVLSMLVAQVRWPRHLTMLPMGPEDAAWALAHQRWGLLAVASAAIFAVVSRDPARRRAAVWRKLGIAAPWRICIFTRESRSSRNEARCERPDCL